MRDQTHGQQLNGQGKVVDTEDNPLLSLIYDHLIKKLSITILHLLKKRNSREHWWILRLDVLPFYFIRAYFIKDIKILFHFETYIVITVTVL